MILIRPFSACVTLLVLVWLAQGTAFGHGGGGGGGGFHGGGGGGFHGGSHESFHPEHHESFQPEHHEYRPDEHHDSHYEPHHDPHYDPHHDPHYDPHYDPYHPVHYDPHHDPHFDPHYPPHYPPHHNPDWDHYLSHHEWWHYHPTWHNRPWWAWWNHPAWIEVSTWFAPWGWSSPIYYNYAPTQVVVEQDQPADTQDQAADTQDQPAATTQPDFQAATTLAAASTDEAQDDQAKWFSLGMFALTKYDEDNPPTQTVQLAVNKEGVLSGMLYDLAKDTSTPIHGSVDKSTQRAAFTLNEKGDVVAETGISNLTEQETSLLVHEGPTQRELYRLTRLDSPPSAGNSGDGGWVTEDRD